MISFYIFHSGSFKFDQFPPQNIAHCSSQRFIFFLFFSFHHSFACFILCFIFIFILLFLISSSSFWIVKLKQFNEILTSSLRIRREWIEWLNWIELNEEIPMKIHSPNDRYFKNRFTISILLLHSFKLIFFFSIFSNSLRKKKT